MSLADVSTARLVLDAQRLDTRTTHAPRDINVPVTRKQRPAASVTSRPVPSVSRSVGTTTRVADEKQVVPPKSSPPMKNT